MAKRPKPVHQMTIKQFETAFPDEEACQRYLVARRWPEGVACPRCGNTDLYDHSSYKPFHWQCRECAVDGYRFSCIAGTVFENTNKPLKDWYRVTHTMLTSKKGVSALQIQRVMGFGSYKTAWYMCHRIRTTLVERDMDKLGGIVEVDETFIGGKDGNKHVSKRGKGGKHAPSNKTPIIGAVQRKGNVVTRVLASVTKDAAQSFVREMVSEKVSLLATDMSPVYKSLQGFNHQTVDHRVVTADNAALENRPEAFNRVRVDCADNVLTGDKVSAKYLPLYIAEAQFKYNNRFNDDIFGAAISQSAEKTDKESFAVSAFHIGVRFVRSQAYCTLRLVDSHNGFFAALAAMVVAGFTITLWIATSKQADLTFQSLKLARQEFVATHRPKVIVRYIQGPFRDGEGREFVWLTFVNVGANTATIEAFGADLAKRLDETEEWVLPGLNAAQQDIPHIVLTSGQRHVFTVTAQSAITDEQIFAEAVRDHQLCLVGSIRYRDGNGVARDTGFFRVLTDDGESFVVSDHDAEMEYQD